MPKIHVLIVDDEKPARERLLQLLQKEDDIEVVGMAGDGHEAIRFMKGRKVDLLFLDVEMPGIDGFAMLRQIPVGQFPITIFVTAYDKYALQAIKAHAFDYLLKPFSDENFEAILQRSRCYLRTEVAGELGLRLAQLLDEVDGDQISSKFLRHIVLRERGRICLVDLGNLDWIEAAGVYVYLHVGQQSHLYRGTMGQLQEQLNPRKFVRVSRSVIVNANEILELRPNSHGRYIIVLKNGTQVPLTQGYRKELEHWLRQDL